MDVIIHGVLLSLGLILPLGVQNVFVFSQGATQPSLSKALPAAITASICDTLLILLAVFGLSIIVLQFEWLRIGLMVIGIVFLTYMGYAIFNTKPVTVETENSLPALKQIVFGISVSLLNPHAILDTVGVIGTSAIKYSGSEQVLFTIACISISWCWFIGLTIAGGFMKKIDGNGQVLSFFNKTSAIFIWCTAIYLFFGLFN